MAKIFITEEQYNRLLSNLNEDIIESENPAYQRKNAKEDNLKAIWNVIDKRQRELYDMVFNELGGKLDSLTLAKSKQMGSEYLDIPNTICNAGNTKLPPSVLIVNMSSSLMCPSFFLGLCQITKGKCYAQVGENRHSNDDSGVLVNRWQTDLMNTQMLRQYQKGNKAPMQKYFNLIETYIQLGNAWAENVFRENIQKLERKKGRPLTYQEEELIRELSNENKITDVRLNETGDFQCQLAVDLWTNFAKKIKKKYGINTHTYTARNLDFSRAADVMAVNPSHKGINLGNNNQRMFIAVGDALYDKLPGGKRVVDRQPILSKRPDGTYYYKCPCKGDETHCDTCGVCFDRNKTGKDYIIYVRYHGLGAADGMKNLFTDEEMKDVIKKSYQAGWITPEEMKQYRNPNNKQQLSNYSSKVLKKRKEAIDKGKKPAKQSTTKK